MMNPLAYPMAQAAEQAGISRARLYELIRDGSGPIVTAIGRRRIILHEDLILWLREQRDRTQAQREEQAA